LFLKAFYYFGGKLFSVLQDNDVLILDG